MSSNVDCPSVIFISPTMYTVRFRAIEDSMVCETFYCRKSVSTHTHVAGFVRGVVSMLVVRRGVCTSDGVGSAGVPCGCTKGGLLCNRKRVIRCI